MRQILIPLVMVVLAMLWFGIALLPALKELFQKTGAVPLRVVREEVTDVRHFARGLQRFLGDELDRLPSDVTTGVLSDGKPFRVVQGDFEYSGADMVDDVVVARGALGLPGETVFLESVYARGNVTTGTGSVFRAIVGDSDVELGDGTVILRFLHSGAELSVGESAVLFGRASAEGTFRIGLASQFERLHAPRIQFGVASDARPSQSFENDRTDHAPGEPDELAEGRWLLPRDIRIPANSLVRDNLVVYGDLQVEPGSLIRGSIKCRGRLEIGDSVIVEGAVVGTEEVLIGSAVRVRGSIVGERAVSLGSGTIVGDETSPATVTAETIRIASGCVVHGTVWPADTGLVGSAHGHE
jgi:predicted acyltransferase (DUF342 family)